MATDPSKNHGEGDPEAAARFNAAETAFVVSPEGKTAIKIGPKVGLSEQDELAEAERQGLARTKGVPPIIDKRTAEKP